MRIFQMLCKRFPNLELLDFQYNRFYREYFPYVCEMVIWESWWMRERTIHYIYKSAKWWWKYAQNRLWITSTRPDHCPVNVHTYEADIVAIIEHFRSATPLPPRLVKVYQFTFLVGRFSWFGRVCHRRSDAEEAACEALDLLYNFTTPGGATIEETCK